MKTLLSLIFAVGCTGQAASLVWDPPALPAWVVRGYAVTISTNDGAWCTNLDTIGLTNCSVNLSNLLAPGCYKASVQTVDTNGITSVPSNEIIFAIPLPVILRLQAQIEWSREPDGPWEHLADLSPVAVSAEQAQAFYRLTAKLGP